MPDPNDLKIGDRIRFVSTPDEWNQPGYRVPAMTRRFIKTMIRRRFPSRIKRIEYGMPWIDARIKVKGKIHYHTYGIDETSGWRLVKSRKPSVS